MVEDDLFKTELQCLVWNVTLERVFHSLYPLIKENLCGQTKLT